MELFACLVSHGTVEVLLARIREVPCSNLGQETGSLFLSESERAVMWNRKLFLDIYGHLGC
jgi:hypothetical protein